MLYLPQGVRNYIEDLAMKRGTNMGMLLIEIVCKWAWENGFRCTHPDAFIEMSKSRSKARMSRIDRCRICGMTWIIDVSLKAGSGSRKPLGYPTVGFVEKR